MLNCSLNSNDTVIRFRKDEITMLTQLKHIIVVNYDMSINSIFIKIFISHSKNRNENKRRQWLFSLHI